VSSAKSAKISISLTPEWLRFAEEYRKKHHLSSRSEVIVLALKKLREAEMAEGFRQMARDYEESPDEWIDSGLEETLDYMDRG